MSYSNEGVKPIFAHSDGVREAAFHDALDACNEYFNRRCAEPSFRQDGTAPVSRGVDASSDHGVRDDNNSALDMSELASVLRTLQRTVEALARATSESINNLNSRINSMEARLESTQSQYRRTPDVVDEDSDDDIMSNTGAQ